MTEKTDTNSEPLRVPLSDQLGGWVAPEGFVVERPAYEPDCVMIGRNSMWVTVDMRGRFYGLGYARPRRWPALDGKPGFTGRGWERRLLSAAVDYLVAEVDA